MYKPKVYLAAPFARQAEMRKYAEQLEGLGVEVTSRWLQEPESPAKPPQLAAVHDLMDIDKCDTFIIFTNPPAEKLPTGQFFTDGGYRTKYNPRGGMHVEFGYARARQKQIWVIGYRENIFYHLPTVEFFESWTQVLSEVYNIKVMA